MSVEVPVKATGMTQPLDSPTTSKDAPHPVAMQVRGLNFYYGTSHALHDISLDFPERSVTGMIGLQAVANPPCCVCSTGCTTCTPASAPRVR